MNRKTLILILSIFVLNMLFTISVGRAYASSCFTDTSGHWAEGFICWMKATGLSSGYPDGTFKPNNFITRAEVAALLYKDESGDTYVNAGPSAWQVNYVSFGSAYIYYGLVDDNLYSSSAGTNVYEVSLPLISAIHGQRLTAKGVKLCYDASLTSGSITDVALYFATPTSQTSIDDSTSLSDASCRAYTFSAPQPLDGTDSLSLRLIINLPSTSDSVMVYGATAIEGFDASPALLGPRVGPQPHSGTSGPTISMNP